MTWYPSQPQQRPMAYKAFAPSEPQGFTPPKTNMTGWKIPTMNEDVSPIKNGDFPASHASFLGGYQSQT